ncbi:MAG TPA: enoyl-CoA hydratase, partial [Acidimicrobiaceae bacterium]|nr:enoyl-CoA hydratase [Acidimicrobiaceae bacterium]
MALPEVTLGMLPAAGGTQSLTRLIGPSAALPLVLTGRRIGAEEARRFGIVWEVVPAAELPARAAALGAQLASLAAGGRQLTRA